jgi:hypothetical protein
MVCGERFSPARFFSAMIEHATPFFILVFIAICGIGVKVCFVVSLQWRI